jgi:hypothetical protein
MCATVQNDIGFFVFIFFRGHMRARNLNLSGQTLRSSGNWLAHWEKTTGQNAYLCFAQDCIKRPTAGGLVQKDSPIDRSWYIVPLCNDRYNKTGQDLEIWDQAVLVRAGDTKDPQGAPFGRHAAAPRVAGSFS